MVYLLIVKNRIIKDKETQIKNILNHVIPVCITDRNFQIIMANKSYWNLWGKPSSKTIKCYDHRPGEDCHTEKCELTQIINGVKIYVSESTKKYNNETRHFILTAEPFLDSHNEIAGIIESFQDITERKKLEDEKAGLIDQLQSSLEKVKLLSGFLPICASCKKIRDDKGYWKQIESYIRDHSEAEFSHGICPECAQKLYPGMNLSETE
jgi:transcriptional regulator with PAS, ATPase and Fis domain